MKSLGQNRHRNSKKIRKGCRQNGVIDFDVKRRRAHVEAWKQRIMAQALNRGYRHAA